RQRVRGAARAQVRGQRDIDRLRGERGLLLGGLELTLASGELLLHPALALTDQLAGGGLLLLGQVLDGAVRAREHAGIAHVRDADLLELGGGGGRVDRREGGIDGGGDRRLVNRGPAGRGGCVGHGLRFRPGVLGDARAGARAPECILGGNESGVWLAWGVFPMSGSPDPPYSPERRIGAEVGTWSSTELTQHS